MYHDHVGCTHTISIFIIAFRSCNFMILMYTYIIIYIFYINVKFLFQFLKKCLKYKYNCKIIIKTMYTTIIVYIILC